MAIYLGNMRLTGTTEIDIGGVASTVYLGNFLTYPEGQISYVFSDVKRNKSFIGAGYTIPASGTSTNKVWVTADVTVKRGSTVIATYDDVTLVPRRVSGDTSYFHITANNEIYADNRSNVSGDTRSAYFTFAYNDVDVPEAAGAIEQQANYAINHSITMSMSNIALVPDQSSHVYQGTYMSSHGGKYALMGQRKHKDWTSYTSGYNADGSSYTTGQTSVTAATYSNLGTWMSLNYQDTRLFTADTNTGTSNRSETITGRFSAGTDTAYTDVNYTVYQYRSSYDTYDYRIASWNITQDSWTHTQSGTSYYATFTADCEYRTAHWDDGTTTYGNWTDYNDKVTLPSPVYSAGPTLICGQGHWGFYTYPSGTASQTIRLNYENQYSTYGRMRVYPVAGNTGASDITNTLILAFGDKTIQTTLTHEGDGSFNISPTSLSFNYQSQSATITVTTALSDWTVSDNAGWITTSVNGNIVTVTVSENTSTSTNRSGIVSFTQGGRTVATCSVSQTKAPAPAIVNVETLFELGNGWIVGRYQTGLIPDQYNTKTYVLVIARADRGTDCTFNFASDGYYNYHQGPTTSQHSWSRATIEYTGQSESTTDFDGNPVSFYGFSIGGGPGAETAQAYAGITIA